MLVDGSFWYDKSIKFLYQTDRFKINHEEPGFLTVDIQPVKEIRKN